MNNTCAEGSSKWTKRFYNLRRGKSQGRLASILKAPSTLLSTNEGLIRFWQKQNPSIRQPWVEPRTPNRENRGKKIAAQRYLALPSVTKSVDCRSSNWRPQLWIIHPGGSHTEEAVSPRVSPEWIQHLNYICYGFVIVWLLYLGLSGEVVVCNTAFIAGWHCGSMISSGGWQRVVLDLSCLIIWCVGVGLDYQLHRHV